MSYGSQNVRKTQKKGQKAVSHRDGFFSDNVIDFGCRQWQAPSDFKPLTSNHLRVIKAIQRSPITIVSGPPGSLKTFLALKSGLTLMKQGFYDNYLYVRQNIFRPREQAKGALPGNESDKFSPLLNPIRDNLNAIVPPGELSYLLSKGRISASDVDSIRGRSPLRTVIHGDECQNFDVAGLLCLLTRKTECSKIILTGDFRGQKDIIDDLAFNAFEEVCKEFKGREGFQVIQLTEADILRDESIAHVIEGFANIEKRLSLKK